MSTQQRRTQQGSLNKIEQHVLETIDVLGQMKTTIQHYSAGSEEHWYNCLNNLMNQYKQLQDHCNPLPANVPPPTAANGGLDEDDFNIHELVLPVEVLAKIDEGFSPDSFMNDVKLEAKKQSELTKGKNIALQTLRDSIEQEAANAFPEEYEEYKKSSGTNNNSERMIKEE